jgi:hypothetical protein
VSGATSDTLTLASTTTSESGNEYRAVFAELGSTATSTAAKLTVLAPPTVTQQPADQAVSAGQSATFTAGASNATSVQWQVSTDGGSTWADVPGATSDTLVVSTTNPANSGNEYRAVFTEDGVKVATNAATLTVPAPLIASLSVAPPVLTQSTDLSATGGTVLIRLPGSSKFTLVSGPINVPFGTTIDATNGVVTLTVALPNGGTQTGEFYDGEFVLTQTRSGTTIPTLTGGSFAACPNHRRRHRHGARDASSHKKPGSVVRQLWGNAHGNYTTKGRYGSAAVSGTIWLVQDLCDGTLIRVTKDNVIVIAYAHPHHKYDITQGHEILIPAPGF